MVSLLAVGLVVAGLVGVLTWRARPAATPVPVAARVLAPARSRPATIGTSTGTPAGTPTSTPAGSIVVAVAGRVRHPGIVTLASGARVIDAIRAAGGMAPGADVGLLNLAQPLDDGEQVIVGIPVPAAAGTGGSGTSGGSAGGVTGVVSGGTAGGVAGGTAGGVTGGRVNLNAATVDQLVALPGIGPVTAQRIVDWRTAHGRFSSVDQLRQVSGIGPAKFAQVRDRVTV